MRITSVAALPCARAATGSSIQPAKAATAHSSKKCRNSFSISVLTLICINLSQNSQAKTSGETATAVSQRNWEFVAFPGSGQLGFQLLAGLDQALHRAGRLGQLGLLII